MQQCWASDPDDRPTFTTLSIDLAQNLSSMADYLTLSRDFADPAANGGGNSSRGSPRYVREPTEPQNQSVDNGYIDLSLEDMHGNTGSQRHSATLTNEDIVYSS